MFLTDDEWLDELYQEPEQPIYSDDHEFVKKRKQRSNEEVSHRNKQLEAIHNRNIKERDGWDPEGDYKLPDTKRREVRDPNFLDDESTLGSIDESEDKGKLGKLVVKNKSEKSINTQESDETTIRIHLILTELTLLTLYFSSFHLLPYIYLKNFWVVF